MRLPPEYVTVDGDLRSLVDEEDAVPAIFRTLSKPNGHTLIGEDIDFVYRAHRLGYKCIYDPVAQVGHFKSVNLGAIETLLSSMG